MSSNITEVSQSELPKFNDEAKAEYERTLETFAQELRNQSIAAGDRTTTTPTAVKKGLKAVYRKIIIDEELCEEGVNSSIAGIFGAMGGALFLFTLEQYFRFLSDGFLNAMDSIVLLCMIFVAVYLLSSVPLKRIVQAISAPVQRWRLKRNSIIQNNAAEAQKVKLAIDRLSLPEDMDSDLRKDINDSLEQIINSPE